MRPIRSRSARIVAVAAAALLLGLLGACSDPQTTLEPRSDFTQQVHDVYRLIAILAGIVFVGVMAATLGFALWFRERPGREAAQFHGNARLEVLWTLIPVVIVLIMIVPTFQVIHDTGGSAPEGALEVEAVGHQWWFEFRYPELGITTANELHLPVDRPVNVKLLSADVIHSFWIPQLVGKTDMVPGHENVLWFTPNEARPEAYLGQCAEFCGTSHANMRFRAFVHAPADFEAWVANETADRREPDSEQLQAGEQLFLTNACIGCHTIKGTAAAGEVGPDLTHIGARTTIASGILDNTPEEMIRWIKNPERVKPGVVGMPPFEGVLNEEQLATLVTYLQSLE